MDKFVVLENLETGERTVVETPSFIDYLKYDVCAYGPTRECLITSLLWMKPPVARMQYKLAYFYIDPKMPKGRSMSYCGERYTMEAALEAARKFVTNHPDADCVEVQSVDGNYHPRFTARFSKFS